MGYFFLSPKYHRIFFFQVPSSNQEASRQLIQRLMRSFCLLGERMTQCCGLLLILSSILLCGDCTDAEHLEISAGHVLILNCDLFSDDEFVSVNWTREPNRDWDADLKVINRSLWFLPARESHNGNYSCYFSNTDGPSEKHFSISVAKLDCPRPAPIVFLYKKRHAGLPFHPNVKRNIGRLNSISTVSWTWMKDCRPLIWPRNSDRIQFPSVTESNGGLYTLVMNFTLNGTSYTMTQSAHVTFLDPGPVPQKPRVIKPRQETLAVKLGSKQVLNCKVFVGPGSCKTDLVEPMSPYWLMNGNFVELKPEYIVFEEFCTTENRLEYRHSDLTIFKVQEEFFNIPFQCVVHSSSGHDNGTVVLIPSREKELYVIVAVFTAFAIAALLFYVFRVDLVLASRSLGPCLKRQNDGKLYDAYVTYPHSDDHSVSLAKTFALHVLPEVLEDRFGYKLFISERDAPPGTAVPDVISETVGKSRRLIIILTPETFTNTSQNKVGLSNKLLSERSSINNNTPATKDDPNPSESSRPNWGPYECRVGLYDALVKECLQVILVQVGGDMDEALLPESLRYVKHTRGILKWKQHHKNKTSGRFWKQMRYRMPPVQKDRPGFTV